MNNDHCIKGITFQAQLGYSFQSHTCKKYKSGPEEVILELGKSKCLPIFWSPEFYPLTEADIKSHDFLLYTVLDELYL